MAIPELLDWWHSGEGRNSYTIVTTKSGILSVYVRRNVFDKSVMEIASVSTITGFGGIRALYGSLTKDIPALAENILNPDLDVYLEKTGWDHAYRDLANIPTRINQAFQKRYPRFKEARTATEAIYLSR